MDNQVYQIKGNSNFSSNLYSTDSDFRKIYNCCPTVSYAYSKQSFTIDIYAPGFNKEDLTINIDHSILHVHGQTSYSSFYRTIKLPEYINTNKYHSSIKNGHLKIVFDVNHKYV